jgi:hypothetical protein
MRKDWFMSVFIGIAGCPGEFSGGFFDVQGDDGTVAG